MRMTNNKFVAPPYIMNYLYGPGYVMIIISNDGIQFQEILRTMSLVLCT